MSSKTNHDKEPIKKIGFSMSFNKTSRNDNNKKTNVLGRIEKGDEQSGDNRNRKGPLVIPLKRYDDKNEVEQVAVTSNDEDEAAIEALLQDGARTLKERSNNASEGTNFSAEGSLVIGKDDPRSGTKERLPLLLAAKQRFMKGSKTDTEGGADVTSSTPLNELKQDLSLRASDLRSDSEAYSKVPISEFGAAMLRGMGWKGESNDKREKDKNSDVKPRHHRLGLGATKKPQIDAINIHSSKRHWAKKPGSAAYLRTQEVEAEEKAWKAKVEEASRKQQTIQDGSIVRLRNSHGDIVVGSRRAIVIKCNGVPGLNRVMIRFEDDNQDEIVKKSDIELVSQSEINSDTFRKQPKVNSSTDIISSRVDKHNSSKDDERSHKRRRSQSRDRGFRKERKEGRSDDRRSWLLPKIRVRVITKKACSGRHYKQKGIILDIIRRDIAVVQMADGEVFESKESWLETALPKAGGNVVVLTGDHKHEKGKLLERQSSKGRAIVQLFDDMQVIKVSLDDIAEWCAPLDTDMDD